MKTLTHFETSKVSGGEVFWDPTAGLVTITKNLEHFTYVLPNNNSIRYTRGTDGMVTAVGTYDGFTFPMPSKYNLCNGQVGKYQMDLSKKST